jgi:hypothetical protein
MDCMEEATDDKSGQPVKPEAPPASETWVEGQPASDADYQQPLDKTE